MHTLTPEELGRRYRALYTGAVSDVLDRLALRNQALPHYIVPLTLEMVVAGPAFTGQGYPVADIAHDDSETRIRMLESIQPGTVSVWSSAGHFESAHWGEIMSQAARERVHREFLGLQHLLKYARLLERMDRAYEAAGQPERFAAPTCSLDTGS